jgi:hypothetical protein
MFAGIAEGHSQLQAVDQARPGKLQACNCFTPRDDETMSALFHDRESFEQTSFSFERQSMFSDAVIGLAAIGTLASAADILLKPNQKQYLNAKVVRLKDWLAGISADQVIKGARGAWVFCLTLGLPLLDQIVSGYIHAGWGYVYGDLILSAPVFLTCAPSFGG